MSAAHSTVLDFADAERERGTCPLCNEPARLRTCWECGDSAWIIDCAHFPQPRPIAPGRADGSHPHRMFCDDCADVIGRTRQRRARRASDAAWTVE
jgi:hypothetical protein